MSDEDPNVEPVATEPRKALQRPFLIIEIHDGTGEGRGVTQEEANLKANDFYTLWNETHFCEAPSVIVSNKGLMIVCFATRLDIYFGNQSRMGAANAHMQMGVHKEAQNIERSAIAAPVGIALPRKDSKPGIQGAF